MANVKSELCSGMLKLEIITCILFLIVLCGTFYRPDAVGARNHVRSSFPEHEVGMKRSKAQGFAIMNIKFSIF